MLAPSTIHIVQTSAPLLQEHAGTIADMMYKIMCDDYPEVSTFFQQAHRRLQRTPHALVHELFALTAYLDRTEELSEFVSLVAHTQVSLGVRPEHYEYIGVCLLSALGEVLGKRATNQLMHAWAEAYLFLVRLFMRHEADVYRSQTISRLPCPG